MVCSLQGGGAGAGGHGPRAHRHGRLPRPRRADFKSDARRFLGRYDVRYVSVRDGGGSTGDAYGITGVPETYWIDGRGRIVDHYPGQINRQQLEVGIRKAQGSE